MLSAAEPMLVRRGERRRIGASAPRATIASQVSFRAEWSAIPPEGRPKRSLALQTGAAIGVICLLLLLPLIAFGLYAVGVVDERAKAREAALIASGLERALVSVSREQQSVTVWDEAVEAVRTGDLAWMDRNIGKRLYHTHGHARVYVLGPDDQPVYAMEHGARLEARAFTGVAAVIGPLARHARSALAEAEPEARQDLVLRDVVRLFGHPHVVSIRPVLPETDPGVIGRGEEYLHVVADRIDTQFLTQLGEAVELHGIRLVGTVPPESASVVPLRGTEGTVANLVWEPERPGSRLMRTMLPALAAVGLGILGAVGVLSARLVFAMRQLDASEIRARTLARLDPLTGLANRASFNTHLREALVAASDEGTGAAVFYIDLDGFKEINDTLGHAAGDAILRQVGMRLAAVAKDAEAAAARDDEPGSGGNGTARPGRRVGALVARLGGDEFTLVQTRLRRLEGAAQLAEAILKSLEAPLRIPSRGPEGETSVEVAVGASVGIAVSGGLVADPGELMRRADVALYAAKAEGRGRFVYYDRSYDQQQRRRHMLDQDLRAALALQEGPAAGGFRVVYQPIFDAAGSEIRGAEALLRWVHPARGPVSPAEFVPVAEERGLMDVLGSFVLREACEMAKACSLPWVAVNVSAAQFRLPDFADRVLALLDEVALSPSRLQLEITETLLLDGASFVEQAILKLRFAGVRISLDDFGTGYSSLSYLTRYRVDKIKIDRSFVARLGEAEDGTEAGDSAAVIRVVLDLARALAIDVTAEGVETEAQWETLRALGADAAGAEMQGYLFSRPLPAEELAELARKHSAAA